MHLLLDLLLSAAIIVAGVGVVGVVLLLEAARRLRDEVRLLEAAKYGNLQATDEPDPAPIVVDDRGVRIVVLRAFIRARRALAGNDELEVRRIAEEQSSGLPIEDDAEDTLRRLFYLLLLAELDRTGDPIPVRRRAKAFAARLASDDVPNPFILYLCVVDASTPHVAGSIAGDRLASADGLVGEEGVAALAVAVPLADVHTYRRLLFKAPLEEWR